MKQVKRFFTIALAIALLLTAFAVPASAYSYAQQARANQKLSLRSGPSTDTEDLGTYEMKGQYVELSAKSWDYINSIWWVRCSFTYKGSRITGWTGVKRFDGATFDLSALPDESTYELEDDIDVDALYGYTQIALANQKLHLREGPSTHTASLGTYEMAGRYVALHAKYWDDENNIWWVLCELFFDDGTITGWTGAKRFDGNTFLLEALQEVY